MARIGDAGVGDVTDDRKLGPTLERLIGEGRVLRASRPGYRPRMRAGEGVDRLSEALAASRAEER